MAVAPIRIPRLQGGRPIADSSGLANAAFLRTINDALGQIENSLNGIQEALDAAGIASAAAQRANAAAAAATSATASNAKEQALVNSYIDPSSVLMASATAITIAAHVRHYADGSTASVNGGSVPATASGDVDYVSYSDPNRTGGSVAYTVTTVQPAQTGSTHVVGAVTVPTTGTKPGGSGPRKPGYVDPEPDTV